MVHEPKDDRGSGQVRGGEANKTTQANENQNVRPEDGARVSSGLRRGQAGQGTDDNRKSLRSMGGQQIQENSSAGLSEKEILERYSTPGLRKNNLDDNPHKIVGKPVFDKVPLPLKSSKY